MITKERLEELIKEKITIWHMSPLFVTEYKLDETYYIKNNELMHTCSYCGLLGFYTKSLGEGSLEEFFETKEDAEAKLKELIKEE